MNSRVSPFLPTSWIPIWLAVLLVACLGGCNQDGSSGTDAYPRRPLTLICPWAAGGGTDQVSRFWADALKEKLGKPCVVVNRTGGSGAVGHTAGARAKPDGYTLSMITFELSTMHQMGITDLTHEDFRCLLQVNADPAAIIVRTDAPWKTLDEFLEAVREKPGELTMSGTAAGGAWDLARAGLLHAAEMPVESIKWVPKRGAAPSLVELLGGHVDSVCCSVPEAAPSIQSGELRVLCVMADERMSDHPDVPTVRESGVPWTCVGWRGLAVPRETPDEIVAVLMKELTAIGNSPEYQEFMQQAGFGITLREGAEFTEFLSEQDETWKDVIQAANYAK